MIEEKLNQLFEKCLTASKLELNEEDMKFLQNNSAKYPMAELCLILYDFAQSRILFSFNGEIDEHDEIQKATFVKLEALGKYFPLAYKVAGELYLGTMGKIIWHSDRALEYYKKYAEATGDCEIIDNYEQYTRKKWPEYNDNMHRQRARRIIEESNVGVTYSHDPLFYDKFKNEEVVEDTIEESIDEDVDDKDTLVDYVLFFKVDAKWPKSKDDFKIHYEFCYPLYLEKKPLFPYFSTLFEVEGIDRIHGAVSLVINRGQGEERIQIMVGEEFAFDFAYQAKPNKITYREGHAVLSLKHFNFGDDSVSGKLVIQNNFVTDNEVSIDQTLYLKNITVDSEEEITADLDSGDSYGILMIDEASKFILCYGLRLNADDEAEEFYVPVWFDKPNEEYVSYNEKRHFNEIINRITYKK